MSTWSSYVTAHSVEEALGALAASPGPALPLAGGSDLLLELKQGSRPSVHTLVDLTAIPELARLELRADRLFIGAAVPLRIIASSPLVVEHARAVAEASALIGGPQVRSNATLGGNVAHALPAADGMIALAALDARVEVASAAGRRLEPILALFRGPGESAIRPDRELLVGFHLRLGAEGLGSAFGRVMRPQGVALPILNSAVFLRREGERIGEIHIVVGPSGPVPRRAAALEELLTGRRVDDEARARLREAIPVTLSLRTSAHRAGADYRYRLCAVLLEEVIDSAWKRAGGQA